MFFIKHGLHQFKQGASIDILEIGFGTGLNCLLTYIDGLERALEVGYTGVEMYPISASELGNMNYPQLLTLKKAPTYFNEIHNVSWNKLHTISTKFNLIKKQERIENVNDVEAFNLIYFDAFGPRVQPELWTPAIFKKMYEALKSNGILVTYSAKGSVRRAMQATGFKVEKLPGPPGKREMLRGVKLLKSA